jgi:23S rRNA (uracil1939-C5)-methyltransferase
MLCFCEMAKEIHVTIESMAFKGYGVARVNGKVVFLPYTVKGEEAWVEIIDEKRDYMIGRVKEIVSSSPWRVTPPCPYFGRCGGCQWQHINHAIQGELKREILEETLKRLAGLHEIPPITLFPSPQPYGYRVRVQLKGQQGRIGYYQEKSHRMIQIDRCPIAHPLINQIIPLLYETPSIFSHMEEIEINVSPEEGRGILFLHPLTSPPRGERVLSDFLQKHTILKGIAVARKGKTNHFGQPELDFTVSFDRNGQTKNLKLRTSPESFFQIHVDQNLRLIRTVIEFGDVKEGENVLDLYAGIGNFTLPLASVARDVTGIEENRTAVKDANHNALANGLERCRFIHGKVEDVLKSSQIEKPDLILLDPPRTGCKSVINPIVDLKPKRIVYVSCEPTTFSRDLRLFSDRGYTLQRLALLDLFPQSYHMEVVALLLSGC